MRLSQHLATFLGAALLLASASSAAQYVWLDEKGRRNYSDRPPPPGVPAARILKAPKSMQQLMQVIEPSAPTPAAAPAEGTVAPSDAAPESATQGLAQRELEYQKRRKESAERAQKLQEDTARAAERKRACEVAANAKAQLESGMRLRSQTSADPNEIMSEAERTAELARTNKILAGCR